MNDDELFDLARMIAAHAPNRFDALKCAATVSFEIGAQRMGTKPFFLDDISHHVYKGDTLLHVAGAAYDLAAAKVLVAAGANVRARNLRGAEPIHYSADGAPGSKYWNPDAQGAVVTFFLKNGADPNAFDKDGVGPLHRAVRTRSTGAVIALLTGGADPTLKSGRGSTPRELATMTTGRGGSGSREARSEQEAIIRLLGG